jgi:hypothetical protein
MLQLLVQACSSTCEAALKRPCFAGLASPPQQDLPLLQRSLMQANTQ